MITREQIEEVFENRKAFTTERDHDVVAINLLRERIPYEVCRGIIGGAEHDVLYLCGIDLALPYLSEKDLEILAECNVGIDEYYFRLSV